MVDRLIVPRAGQGGTIDGQGTSSNPCCRCRAIGATRSCCATPPCWLWQRSGSSGSPPLPPLLKESGPTSGGRFP
jgi:hypothetical protein